MRCCRNCIAVFVHILASVFAFDPFSDNTLFDVSWAGPLRAVKLDDGKQDSLASSAVFITTKDNEKYKCLIPKIRQYHEGKEPSQSGPTPEEMLQPLFKEERCSYRLEGYWNYELCHGRHIRQFHEDRTAEGVKLQEYFMGKITKEKKDAETGSPVEEPRKKADDKEVKKVPTRRVDGVDLPYYEVIMSNGTPCDLLNSAPRITHILYICNPTAENEMRSVKELQTCEYEVELMTPLLCANDNYRPKEEVVNQIQCHSMENSPREPTSYVSHVREQMLNDLRLKQKHADAEKEQSAPQVPQYTVTQKSVPAKPDRQITRDFFSGDHCLIGGKGWWQYEFCYRKHVVQFHEEKGRRMSSIYLGHWDKEKHVDWLQTRTKTTKTAGQVTHMYANGDYCDESGEPRHVLIKMKCKKSSELQQFIVYLLEPSTCKYVFVVESPVLCPLMEHADQHELFPDDVMHLIT